MKSEPTSKAKRPGSPKRRATAIYLEGVPDLIASVMVAAVGGSAAVVAALGQFVLAGVLALVALGIVLRLWRSRRRRRVARTGVGG